MLNSQIKTFINTIGGNITLKKQICLKHNFYWYDTEINRYSCTINCCMIRYLNLGYLRFKTEPNPMILGRLLIGNPNKYDNYLDQYYTGSLGSDMRTCGLDKNKNTLYYIGSNTFNCHRNYNTDASYLVRINLNNFTFER